jgi:carbamoyltransferase
VKGTLAFTQFTCCKTRLDYSKYIRRRQKTMNAHSEVLASHRRLMQYDPVLGYRFAPGLKVRIPHEGGGYLVKTNRDGFRCEHNVTPTKSKARRVLVFGDSYTAGDGVSNGKRYSDVLEQNLDDTEVLNFGLSGSGTDQQYLIFKQYSDRFVYDAVVISVLVENIRRNVAKDREWSDRVGESICVPKPWFEMSSLGELTLMGVPVPPPYKRDSSVVSHGGAEQLLLGARKIVNRLGPDFKDRLQKMMRFQPLREYGSADNYSWKLMQAILAKWVSEIKVPMMIAVFPVYQYVEETANYKDVRKRFDELACRTRVPIYHVMDDLMTYPVQVRRSFRFRTDDHPTPLAHKLVGEAMAKHLAPLLETGKPHDMSLESKPVVAFQTPRCERLA